MSCTSASASFALPPRGIGMPPSCTATAISCVMNPEVAASGPRPVCRTHGASRPCARSDANVVCSQSRLDCSRSPANSAAPPLPRRRTAFAAKARPDDDQSSVPSTPKARSAFGKNRSRTAGHSGPISAALPSASRSRNDEPPSGNAVAVGSSVFRYSRPRAARSSPSCACAPPPTQSGCHALKTSWTKPGSVISAVRIAPPSQSFRSRTQTSQPPFASSAAQASELMPLPMTTASCSDIEDVSELIVGDEPALPRAEGLHLREHVGSAVLRQLHAEFLGLDPDRVEPALLAEDDAALGGDELGRIWLDRRRVVELRRDGARLSPEERLAGDRLPRLERVAGKLLHTPRHLANPVELEVRLDAVQRAERQRRLGEIRVPGALAHAVDRPLHPLRAGAHRRDRRCRRKPEVVVAVEVHRHVGADPGHRLADELHDRFR